jgi:hypothetical protein
MLFIGEGEYLPEFFSFLIINGKTESHYISSMTNILETERDNDIEIKNA